MKVLRLLLAMALVLLTIAFVAVRYLVDGWEDHDRG